MWAPCEQHTLQYLDSLHTMGYFGVAGNARRADPYKNRRQMPGVQRAGGERWMDQILLHDKSPYASVPFCPRGVPISNSSRARLLLAPCHCVNDSLTRRKTEARFCTITFIQPHAPLGGK